MCRYHGTGAEVVKALKFGRDLRALEVMGPLLAERAAGAAFAGGIDVVTPVPLHWARRLARRFNQSELLAERVAERLRAGFEPKAMKRLRYTTPQAMLSGREREENLRGAFAVRDRAGVAGARVLLVDDVMTTCATARECARALLEAGARSVDVAVFAR
ncbi:MAG TPA: phosphoribosyltransferase family protein [Candidatus Brocadiia bacterium]|nr:phosphoribosyltransferase family protein [Candidatus Brocadiia bacterium]